MRTRRLFRTLPGRSRRKGISELSTSAIHRAVLRAIENVALQDLTGAHLDIGSGTGELLRLVGARYSLQSFACDYTDRLMEPAAQKVDIVDLNREPLPYPDNHFALVTCIETIEHVENFRELIREIYRVLEADGVAVISTPNILNLRSRLRFLSSGFYNLFGPLALDEEKVHSTRGHINPVNWFYLAHALLTTGFRDFSVTVDKYQRRSFLALVPLILPIYLGNYVVYRRDTKQYRTISEKTAWIVHSMNSADLLLGRTLIVTAIKPR